MGYRLYAAVERHGPLRLIGVVTGAYARDEELAQVETDLEGRFFVEIPVDLAIRLLAELDGR